ncbi:hypothetical protein H1R20_g5107, partial [Candolleomyces eurysporus]
MASAAGHDYDEHLLSSAPKPDRRALQEGYDPTLLETKPEKPRSSTPRQASSPTPGPGSPIDRDRDVERGVVVPGAVAPKPGTPAPARAIPIVTPTKSKPFYKTKKGLLIIAGVLIAVIVAAVVGGVVGGRKKSSTAVSDKAASLSNAANSGTSTAQPGTTQGSDPDTGGQGGNSNGGQAEPTGQDTGSPTSTFTGQPGPPTPPPPSTAPFGIPTGALSDLSAPAESGQPGALPGIPPTRRWLD